ncbi:hypothetical protein CCDG5_1764 [[Clostridium] cellulosi]|uniref:Bacterial transcription activator effector binding domain-containing protein n=1 Tax=[Clostridium] cellulosi TaxID=29343 RepID=A0A078KR40_9FIRM|nr:hypothetical protein CCDG5_1764 [[Clostridium] cellulosi]
MSEKLQLRENKALKITNALIYGAPLDAKFDIQRIVYMMQSYIKTKGWQTRGPLITSTSLSKSVEGSGPVLNTKIILQLTKPAESCESPYTFEPLIRVSPCLFVRFTGSVQDLQYASMKASVYAFENDIKLDGSSYTVFVNQNDQYLLADVFMPIRQDVK